MLGRGGLPCLFIDNLGLRDSLRITVAELDLAHSFTLLDIRHLGKLLGFSTGSYEDWSCEQYEPPSQQAEALCL